MKTLESIGIENQIEDTLSGIVRDFSDKKNEIKKENESKKIAFQKAYNKALRKQYTFEDSIKSGNCVAGTRAFIMRLKLDETKKYRGKYLLDLAKEKSTSSVPFVERMIKSKC